MSMVEDGDQGPFKRPGAVPFNWEIRPGIPKIRTQHDNGTTLLQPPKKLSTLRITKLPPSPSSSPAVSPFAPPPSSFKLKPRQDSHSSGRPPNPYWRCSSARATTLDFATATALRRWGNFKSYLRFKKSKTPDVKNKTGLDLTTKTLEESDVFYDSEETTTCSPSESSSLSSSYFRMKRNESDLSSSEKRIILMRERDRLIGM